MPYVNEFDTIAAIATAAGSGGIGIVRISGENAMDHGYIIEKVVMVREMI